MKRPTIDEATKAEIQKLVAGLPSSSRSRFSSLYLKMGACYAAMALFTIAALALSSFNLSLFNNAAREVANVDLRAVSALINMRGSLLAQESFAGKYAILKDPTFIELCRQRRKEALANLAVLELTGSSGDIAALKRLYIEYQEASEQLFAGKSESRKDLQAAALRVLGALDALYAQRQNRIQAVLERAEQSKRATTRWIILISCVGFLLAVSVAPFVLYRILRGLNKLQQATHRIALGDFHYSPQVPAAEEITGLASDFNQMAAKILEMEQKNLDLLPLTRLPGNAAIERVLEERLAEGAPFAFCTARVEQLPAFIACYGYARASELLSATGALICTAVKENGAASDFAGHVGGEQFVMVVSPERVEHVCQAVIEIFDAEVLKYCSPTLNPVATIAISVIDCSREQFASAVEIAAAAVRGGESEKEVPGSSWERITSCRPVQKSEEGETPLLQGG